MLRKSFHGGRMKQETQKSTAIRTPSPNPNPNPVRESPASPTRPTPLTSLCPLSPLLFYRQNLPPTSHFRFTHQITKFPLSTSSLATGSADAYCSRAPEPEPNTYLEDPNLNVGSLRESSDDQRENGGDGEGFGRRGTLPEERVLLYTCVPEDGECCVYVVRTKHNSPEFCREKERTLCIKHVSRYVTEWHDCPPGRLLWLKQNPKVVNKLEVYPGDACDVAMEEIMKYRGKVANKPEVYLGRGFRVAYEAAMKYAVGFMRRHFLPLRVALCDQMPLRQKITLIEDSLLGFECYLPWIKGAAPSKCSLLWCVSVLQLLDWIQSGFGRRK